MVLDNLGNSYEVDSGGCMLQKDIMGNTYERISVEVGKLEEKNMKEKQGKIIAQINCTH